LRLKEAHENDEANEKAVIAASSLSELFEEPSLCTIDKMTITAWRAKDVEEISSCMARRFFWNVLFCFNHTGHVTGS
jgi:hypothetical protein